MSKGLSVEKNLKLFMKKDEAVFAFQKRCLPSIPYSTLNMILNGKTADPDEATLQRIARDLTVTTGRKVSVAFLRYGTPPPDGRESVQQEARNG